MKQPCIVCNELTDNGTRCSDCERSSRAMEIRTKPSKPKRTAEERGYTSDWKRLSRMARRMQPFCSDCGSTSDLQADHTPEAWQRKQEGKRIRLQDIDVVCGPCNRARGEARPGSARAAASKARKR